MADQYSRMIAEIDEKLGLVQKLIESAANPTVRKMHELNRDRLLDNRTAAMKARRAMEKLAPTAI